MEMGDGVVEKKYFQSKKIPSVLHGMNSFHFQLFDITFDCLIFRSIILNLFLLQAGRWCICGWSRVIYFFVNNLVLSN